MAGARTGFGAPVRLEQEVAGQAELQAGGYCSSWHAGEEGGRRWTVAVGWADV